MGLLNKKEEKVLCWICHRIAAKEQAKKEGWEPVEVGFGEAFKRRASGQALVCVSCYKKHSK